MIAKFILLTFLALFQFQGVAQNFIESVPIKFVDNYLFIEVQINNQEKPLNFLFDTGAGITVIDKNVSTGLSLEINGETKISTSGKSLLSEESRSNQVQIGKKIYLDDIGLILMDLDHLSSYLKTNVDGVIGYDLLKKFITETNIDRKEFRFYESDSILYNGNPEPIDLTTLESNLFGILIEVTPKNSLEKIELNFQIDTGADNYLSFHQNTVKKYHLINERKKYKSKKGFGADSTITTNLRGKVTSTSFGGKKWKNIPVMFEVDPINKRENSLADGLIGQRLLLDFNIIYDLNRRLVYFEKRK